MAHETTGNTEIDSSMINYSNCSCITNDSVSLIHMTQQRDTRSTKQNLQSEQFHRGNKPRDDTVRPRSLQPGLRGEPAAYGIRMLHKRSNFKEPKRGKKQGGKQTNQGKTAGGEEYLHDGEGVVRIGVGLDAEDGVEVDFRDGLPSGGGGPPGNVLGEQRLLGGDGGDGRHERLGWKRRSGGLRNTRCGRRGFEGEGEDVEEEVVEEYAAPLMQPQDERDHNPFWTK